MKIAIIGAGCVGSVIYKHLYDTVSKEDLFLIASGVYAEKLERDGVIVNDTVYPVQLMKENDSPVELVFVCVKNFDLMQACEDIRKFIDDNTIIMPLLNSVSPTPTIQKIFPNNRVLYGYITKIDAYLDNSGYRYNIPGDIHFGYADNTVVAAELDKLRNLLSKSGFNAFIDKDMIRGVWKKWMLNVGANQVSALTEANYLHFAKIPEIEKILRLAMQELLMIACYENVNLCTTDITEIVEYLTTYQYPKQTSMLQDIMAHRKTEIDYISGDIIKLSEKWNCPCPVNLTMYYLIKSKESTYLN